MKKMTLALNLALLSALLSALISLGGASAALAADPDPNVAAADETLAPLGSDQSYVVCYFGKADENRWRWALAPGNDWYQVSGTWKKTPLTRIDKFFSSAVTAQQVRDACIRSQVYYQEKGDILAIFAATSNAGSNYPFVVRGKELSPDY